MIRAAADAFFNAGHKWITWMHVKVIRAILACGSPALGAHIDRRSQCEHQVISFNSCQNRHCPNCQAKARNRWLEARQRDLLPVAYARVVFTLPHQFGPLALRNKRVVFDLLFRASAETLLEVARDPRLLGAEIGFFSVLHSWNQKLQFHPHVHCVVPAGGLAADHFCWITSRRRFFLPKDVLRVVFQGKFVDGLEALYAAGELNLSGALHSVANPNSSRPCSVPCTSRTGWCNVNSRFEEPSTRSANLGSYTHRIAISNYRLTELRDGKITFRWRDSAHGNQQRLMTIPAEEFLPRLLLHVLPPGFARIRYLGFFAHRRRTTLVPLCFALLARTIESVVPMAPPVWQCPLCGGAMIVIERLSRLQALLRAPPTCHTRRPGEAL